MGFIQAGPYRLFLTELGVGRSVVFVHGANGNHLSWWQQMPALAARYRCLAYDQPGFGLSPSPTTAVDAACFADALEEMLGALAIERACLVGQSLGCATVVGFALANPDRVSGLVLAGGLGGLGDPGLPTRLQAHRLERGIADDLYRGALPSGFRAHRPELAFLYDCIAWINPPRPPGPVPGAFTGDLAEAAVARFPKPVLLIVGEDDALVPADAVDRVVAAFPNGRAATVRGAGHSAHFEDAPAFNAILAAFLADLAW